jgi:glycosyltransferase involved in cell wall biosynthesis
MKIVILADGSIDYNLKKVKFGSWIQSFMNKQNNDGNEYIYITSVYFLQRNINIVKNNIRFLSFKRFFRNPTKLDLFPSKELYSILKRINPDVIHIYGTEFSHTYKAYIALKKLGKIKNTLLSIQGIISEIAIHYLDEIPFIWKFRPSLKDLIKINNLFFEMISYKIRGFLEQKLISKFINIAGRTKFDLDFIKKYGNKDLIYFQLEELLRDTFYDGKKWNFQNCEQYTIFISASEYPIKGIHSFFRVLPKLIKQFPKLKVKIIGKGPSYGLISSLKNDSYQNYIKYLIKKLNIKGHIEFVGYFNADGFKEQLLKTNLFLLCSNIENSPNSLMEAIQLNVPSIAHNVGGIPSIIKNSNVYTYNNNLELYKKVKDIFIEDTLKFSQKNDLILNSSNHQVIFHKYIEILKSLK